jgi:hypothetical protein
MTLLPALPNKPALHNAWPVPRRGVHRHGRGPAGRGHGRGREGLAEDWLNDAVKGFLPGPDPNAQRFYSSDSLIVDVASPCYLLAMKLFAARAEIDADDIILLYRQLGFTTVDEGLDLVKQAYPGRPIPPRVMFLLTEIVDSMQR